LKLIFDFSLPQGHQDVGVFVSTVFSI